MVYSGFCCFMCAWFNLWIPSRSMAVWGRGSGLGVRCIASLVEVKKNKLGHYPEPATLAPGFASAYVPLR